jgi:hypothetical protein
MRATDAATMHGDQREIWRSVGACTDRGLEYGRIVRRRAESLLLGTSPKTGGLPPAAHRLSPSCRHRHGQSATRVRSAAAMGECPGWPASGGPAEAASGAAEAAAAGAGHR